MRASVLKSLPAVAMAVVVVSSSTGFSQDRMVLGAPQFEYDRSGKGAVLCIWSIYLSVQAGTKACQLPRRPVDDAIDSAISKIDDFIMANSSLHPVRAALEDFKRRATERFQTNKGYCEGPSLENFEAFRRMSPEAVQKSVTELLEVPREPVMNPCV
jgi:hypothetical protein